MEIREVTRALSSGEKRRSSKERKSLRIIRFALPSIRRRVHANLSRIVQQLKHNSKAYEPWRIARQTDVKVWVMAGSVADLFRYFTDSASLLASTFSVSAFLLLPGPVSRLSSGACRNTITGDLPSKREHHDEICRDAWRKMRLFKKKNKWKLYGPDKSFFISQFLLLSKQKKLFLINAIHS